MYLNNTYAVEGNQGLDGEFRSLPSSGSRSAITSSLSGCWNTWRRGQPEMQLLFRAQAPFIYLAFDAVISPPTRRHTYVSTVNFGIAESYQHGPQYSKDMFRATSKGNNKNAGSHTSRCNWYAQKNNTALCVRASC